MARTPKTRGGSKSEPQTADATPESIPAADNSTALEAPAEFAASESLLPEGTAAPESRNGTPGIEETPEDDARPLAEPPAFGSDAMPEAGEAGDGSAAPEALTPGENAALAEPPADAASAPTASGEIGAEGPPETPPAPDALPPSDAFEFRTMDDEPPRGDAPPQSLSDLSPDASTTEMEGPGIAATPVPADAEAPSAARELENPSETGREEERASAPAYAGPAPRAREARSRGGLFAAGLLGGLAALLLAGLLQAFGFLPAAGSTDAGGSQAFQSEIEGLKAEIASLRQSAAQPGAGDPALASDLEALKAEVAQIKSAGSGEAAAVPAELESRLAAAEQKLSGLNEGASAEQLAALSDKVTAAEALARGNDGAIKEAAGRLGALEQNFSGVQGSVSELQASIGELQKGMETLQAQPRVALALAASALKEAADRGAPFTAELATLGTLAPDAPEIKQLQAYAESGVPTRQALLADWNASVDAVLATANPTDENAGLMSRLLSGAGSLVSVRPIGAVEGTSTAAIVGRVQAALDAGDLQKALAEYDALPEAAKGAASGFAEKARARLAVESLVDGAITSAAKAA